MWLYSLQMAFVLPNSRWSGAQIVTTSPFETASTILQTIENQIYQVLIKKSLTGVFCTGLFILKMKIEIKRF
jgi:hypothetical protein